LLSAPILSKRSFPFGVGSDVVDRGSDLAQVFCMRAFTAAVRQPFRPRLRLRFQKPKASRRWCFAQEPIHRPPARILVYRGGRAEYVLVQWPFHFPETSDEDAVGGYGTGPPRPG
jgi:hypothetical protein